MISGKKEKKKNEKTNMPPKTIEEQRENDPTHGRNHFFLIGVCIIFGPAPPFLPPLSPKVREREQQETECKTGHFLVFLGVERGMRSFLDNVGEKEKKKCEKKFLWGLGRRKKKMKRVVGMDLGMPCHTGKNEM